MALGLAAFGMPLVGVITAEDAAAACAGSTSVTCSGVDANGHTATTTADTTVTIVAGQPTTIVQDTIRINLNGAAGDNDLTWTMLDPFSQVNGINGHGISVGGCTDFIFPCVVPVGVLNGGGVQNYQIDGIVTGQDGNAVNVLLNQGGTITMNLGETSFISATGNDEFLGVPTEGGGVVLSSVSGVADMTVNANGVIRSQNDGVFMTTGLGSGTMTVNNTNQIGQELVRVGGTGVNLVGILNAGANGVVNNDDSEIWGTEGGVSIAVGGNATVSNLGGLVDTIDGAGIQAISALGGSTIVNSTGGAVNSTNGPGIVGISLAGTSTVDAGAVTSGSDAVELFGFSLPVPIPGSPTLSGGVLSMSYGDAVANAHGDITTTGTFGVLALSVNGAATAHSDVGITIDPPIGMAAITFSADPLVVASVDNNATVNATDIGLLALNLGAGNAQASNAQGAVVTAPISATAVSLAANASVNNINLSTLNGAVAIVAGQDATLFNAANSQINMSGVSGIVMAAGRDAIIANESGSDISFDGPLSFNVMFAGQDAIINNAGDGVFGSTSFVMGGDISVNAMVAGRDATINNTNGATFALDGDILNANLMVAGEDALINNYNGSSFTMLGALNGNLLNAGVNATILNDLDSDFTMVGLVNGNFMDAGTDATIVNDRGSDFTMAGLASGNVMFAGNDATIINDGGSNFSMLGLVNGNLMSAGSDATIVNNEDSDFTMVGLVNGNFMGAGNDATIVNDLGSDFTMAGLGSGNVMLADHDATIVNDRDSDFTMLGLVNGNFMVAGNDATIFNDEGSEFSMFGVANGNLVAGGNNATINNTNESDFTLAGLANGQLIVAVNGDATINNLAGSEMTFADIVSAQALAAGDWATINNIDSTMNFLGLANVVGFLGANGDEFNNEGLVYVRGTTAFEGLDNFNNSYGTLSMVDDEVDDTTLTSGNFNGGDESVLAIDAELTPGGDADFLGVGGDLTGETFVAVNDLDDGPGEFDPNGVLFAVVDGASNSENFTTGGGIDKGLYRYDAYLLPDSISDSGENEWYLASTLDREAYEFPMMMGAAQSLWNYSTGTWLDRTADLRTALNGGGMPACAKDCPPTTGIVTPGFWMKAVGATTSRDFSRRSSPPVDMLGPTYSYKGGVDQDIYGFLGGVDFGNQGVSASGTNEAWLFGIMGGYVGSDLSYDKSSTDVDYSAGSIGAYATYLNGGWFVDAVIKADIGNMDYSSNLGGGFSDSTSSDFTSIGGVLDTGYRFDGGSGLFFEPKATLSYVSTDIDNANVLGTNVKFDDGDSLLGRLGGRIGTSMDGAASITELYLEASAWNEFEGDYKASLLSNGFSVPVGYDTGGVYGEVAGGVNIFGTAEGWNGFAKAAVQFGEDDFLGYSGNLGFRYGF